MLQFIRNNTQGIFVWIIVGLIILAFTVVGLGSYFSGASKVVTASVNGVDINETQVTRAYQDYQERLKKMFGAQYRPEMFSENRIKSEVIQNLITQEVLTQMIESQKYVASSEQVLKKLNKYEAFQSDGKFSAVRYKEVLKLQGINGEAFESGISKDIASQQIRNAITKSAFLTTKEQAVLAELENQKRVVGYFEINLEPYQKIIKVTDKEIKAYYEKNSHLFLTQEKVQLEYIELNMDKIAAKQDISNEMIMQQYESSPENYMGNDEASAEKKVNSILKQIKSGYDFSDMAKKHSQDTGSAKQGGDLGYLTKGVNDEFDKIVFGLKKGEVSKVVKSKSGFQIIKLDDIRTGDPEERKVRHILIKAERKLKPLAEVSAAIKKELQYQQAGKVFFDDADKMNNLSFDSPDSLKPVAEALGLNLKSSDLMTRRGGAGILANPKVLTAAFSTEVLKEGRNSELLEISDSHLMLLRVKQHQAASTEPLKNVKLKIKNTLLTEKADKKAEAVTVDILTSLKNKEIIEVIKKRYPEIKWHKSELITRKAEKDSKLPEAIRKHVYTMAKPQGTEPSWDRLSLSAGNKAVIALYKVEKSGSVKIADSLRFTQILGNADYSALVENLKSQADVSIFQRPTTN